MINTGMDEVQAGISLARRNINNLRCADHNKPWKILKKMGISDHLTHLLRNLYAGQETTVNNGHGMTD